MMTTPTTLMGLVGSFVADELTNLKQDVASAQNLGTFDDMLAAFNTALTDGQDSYWYDDGIAYAETSQTTTE